MSLWIILTSSICSVFAFLLFYGAPAYFIFSRFPQISRLTCLYATFGLYSITMYLKPVGVPLATVPPFLLAVSFYIGRKTFLKSKLSIKMAYRPPALYLTLAYCFFPFLLRWDPPGTDPIKWASLARIIFETGTLPGNTWPISSVTNLKGATLGVPILLAFPQMGGLIPLERTLFFYECLTLALFIFGLSSVLSIWFPQKVAQRTAFLSLIFFTTPQHYITWGGTPTLMAMLAGFIAIEWAERLRKNPPGKFEIFVYGLALAYGAYAHPIGFYLSGLVALPLLAWRAIQTPRKHLTFYLFLGGAFLFCFAPFFRYWAFNVSPSELVETWDWQRRMAPYLFRTGHGLLENLARQISSYLWSTAAEICFILGIIAVIVDKSREKYVFTVLWTLLLSILVANVVNWKLPLSFLIYPERAATLLILPFSIPLAWLIQTYLTAKKLRPRILAAFTLIFIYGLGVKQFSQRLYPDFAHSGMTENDRAAFAFIAKNVPPEECVEIEMEKASMWVAPLSFRCTRPFHGLAMNSLDAEKRDTRKTPWRFIADGRPLDPSWGKLVYDQGAHVQKR